jgi:hypothetical protein
LSAFVHAVRDYCWPAADEEVEVAVAMNQQAQAA